MNAFPCFHSEPVIVPRNRKVSLPAAALGFTVAVVTGVASGPSAADPVTGFVYTESNLADNSVLVFDRAADGALSLAATVPTGGAGGGVVSVGSQGALAVSQNRQYVFAVNEGGNSVSVLKRTAAGLTAVGTVSSGGTLPVSITVSGNLVYVLNDGVSGSSNASITGFTFNNSTGGLTPIANSTRSLSAPSPTPPTIGPIAPQIQFDNTGHVLFVTETGTSLIDAYTVNPDGTPSKPLIQQSVGSSPFALAFTPQNNLLVTEVRESLGTALQGATTSYQLSGGGLLTPISGSVPDSQTAPCWIIVTPDGKFAYVVNTASGVISGYQVGSNGGLSLLGDGVTAQTPPGPLDDAFLDGDLFDVTSGGSIVGFQVQADGALTSLDLSAIAPAGSRGLVAIAVPEPSTWAMILLGFAGLAALGARKAHAPTAAG
jgi:6-phosphogluconolactonase